MPAALAAVLLLAATVDQRPAGPPRLLAEVGARDTSDGYLGPFVAALPESVGVTLAVAGFTWLGACRSAIDKRLSMQRQGEDR